MTVPCVHSSLWNVVLPLFRDLPITPSANLRVPQHVLGALAHGHRRRAFRPARRSRQLLHSHKPPVAPKDATAESRPSLQTLLRCFSSRAGDPQGSEAERTQASRPRRIAAPQTLSLGWLDRDFNFLSYGLCPSREPIIRTQQFPWRLCSWSFRKHFQPAHTPQNR